MSGDEPKTTATARAVLDAPDYGLFQQCIHCGMCLPTCPTFNLTGLERHSPRGRIAWLRAIRDGDLPLDTDIADELDFCLGCYACMSACPAGVNYPRLFSLGREAGERVRDTRGRGLTGRTLRGLTLHGLFLRPRLLRTVARLIRVYQRMGGQWLLRKSRLNRLLPRWLQRAEAQAPRIAARFTPALLPEQLPAVANPAGSTHRVGLFSGCIQDLTLSEVNRDTAEVLASNGCTVVTPAVQPCCGALAGHAGALDAARQLARRTIDLFPPEQFDALVSNASGCGSWLKKYSELLADDPDYAARAAAFAAKVRDVHEYLVEIGFRAPTAGCQETKVTYHEPCSLCHSQKVRTQPRAVLDAIPGLERVELTESNWCCGSAGIYSVTQPEAADALLARKLGHVAETGAECLLTANVGCHLWLEHGLADRGHSTRVRQPVSLLAEAYRAESRPPPA